MNRWPWPRGIVEIDIMLRWRYIEYHIGLQVSRQWFLKKVWTCGSLFTSNTSQFPSTLIPWGKKLRMAAFAKESSWAIYGVSQSARLVFISMYQEFSQSKRSEQLASLIGGFSEMELLLAASSGEDQEQVSFYKALASSSSIHRNSKFWEKACVEL